jgi:hypothetical protein
MKSRKKIIMTANLKAELSPGMVRVGIFKLSNIYIDSRDLHSAFASIPRVQLTENPSSLMSATSANLIRENEQRSS